MSPKTIAPRNEPSIDPPTRRRNRNAKNSARKTCSRISAFRAVSGLATA